MQKECVGHIFGVKILRRIAKSTRLPQSTTACDLRLVTAYNGGAAKNGGHSTPHGFPIRQNDTRFSRDKNHTTSSWLFPLCVRSQVSFCSILKDMSCTRSNRHISDWEMVRVTVLCAVMFALVSLERCSRALVSLEEDKTQLNDMVRRCCKFLHAYHGNFLRFSTL